jgi:acylphosphatase
MERRTIHYSGRVQGVGFRYTTRAIAGNHNITGYVQNLDDGRVQVIVEGESEEIDRFLTDIADKMSGYIRSTQVLQSSAIGEFNGFSIRH